MQATLIYSAKTSVHFFSKVVVRAYARDLKPNIVRIVSGIGFCSETANHIGGEITVE
jgi:hypothetical protein